MREKIRVLHISPDGKLYGTERHILAIVKHSDRSMFEHTVAVPSHGNFSEELQKTGIRTVTAGRVHGYKGKFEGIFGEGARRLLRLIKGEKFDIVHTHLNSFGGFIGKLAGARSLVHTRHGVFWSEDELKEISFFEKTFQKLKSGIFDLTIAIGDYEKKTLTEILGYDPRKVRTTINGVDASAIRRSVENSPGKKELFGTDLLIAGAVGRLERQKGFHYLIEAASGMDLKAMGLMIVIIGNGSLKNELEGMISEAGLSNSFRIMDYKRNILDYVNRFDFCVSTSLWEGMSYSVQEAMALSKPVIALTGENVSGLGEIIADHKTGFLISDNYFENLRKRMSQLAEDAELRESLGKASLEREMTNFPEWRTARDMDGYYLELENRR